MPPATVISAFSNGDEQGKRLNPQVFSCERAVPAVFPNIGSKNLYQLLIPHTQAHILEDEQCNKTIIILYVCEY